VGAALCLLGVGVAQAELFDRGGGLIYDSDLKITWLADANYARTSGYDADGLMNFSAANTWAAGLSYGGYDDWRLPTALNPGDWEAVRGYRASGEMSHMYYYNMGAVAGGRISEGNVANFALFTNLQSSYYWSGTVTVDLAQSPAGTAWFFATEGGYQGSAILSNEMYAWAVRPGDVAPIPEPESYAMLLAGLGLLGFLARRRKQQAA
jgi:hypothetical protein